MIETRMPAGDYKKILIRIPPDLFDKLEEEAHRQHRSINGQLLHVLSVYIAASSAPLVPLAVAP